MAGEVRNESVKVFEAKVRYIILRGGMRKRAATFLTERSLKRNDPENSPKKLPECVWELTPGRFKNCRGAEGENKCSTIRRMPEILIIGPRGILRNEVCGPLELQVKRVSLRTSLGVPEQATMASCFPDSSCCSPVVSFAVLGQEERNRESFVPSTAQKATSWKRSLRRKRSRE